MEMIVEIRTPYRWLDHLSGNLVNVEASHARALMEYIKADVANLEKRMGDFADVDLQISPEELDALIKKCARAFMRFTAIILSNFVKFVQYQKMKQGLSEEEVLLYLRKLVEDLQQEGFQWGIWEKKTESIWMLAIYSKNAPEILEIAKREFARIEELIKNAKESGSFNQSRKKGDQLFCVPDTKDSDYIN